jgi:hypothetical protein
MKDIPRLVPVWLLLILVLVFSLVQCGCITKRGSKIGGGYIKGEDGIYRKPNSTQIIEPAKSPPSKRVPLKATYEPPNTEIIKKHSVSPAPQPNKDIKSSGKLEKLPPIVPETKKKIGLGLITIELPDDNENETSNVKPIDASPTQTTTGDSGTTDDVKVNWGELFIFYLNATLVLFFIYFVYKLIKGEILWKEPDISKHLKNLGTKKNVRRRNTKKAGKK